MAETKKKQSTTKKKRTPSMKTVVKRQTKKAVKKASKTKGGLVALVLILIAIISLGIVWYFVPLVDGKTLPEYFDLNKDETSLVTSNSNSDTNSKISSFSSTSRDKPSTISFTGESYPDFSIYFLELGNWYTGDSIYIKSGDIDILIDAGSRANSATAISNFIDSKCTDGKLEYVIATHAHEDHIAAFSGTSQSGILYKYEIGTIIEFAQTDSTSKVYENYVTAKNYAKSKGTKVYTALEAYNNPSLRTITLAPDLTMTTLYQKYYETKASTENNYSVCTLFTYKAHNFLFTGDLEKEGEKSLVENNSLPEVELYKAGHHGSKTSSSNELMEVIKPKTVCVCCCAGSNEYTETNENQFPTQEFINRVGIYTNNIYVTSIRTDNKNKTFRSMNGTICFSSNGTNYKVICSDNNMVLKDTDWFEANRTWPEA